MIADFDFSELGMLASDNPSVQEILRLDVFKSKSKGSTIHSQFLQEAIHLNREIAAGMGAITNLFGLGYATTDEVTHTVMELSRQLNKMPVEVNDYPGFIANRILMPMINEAIYALFEGVAGVSPLFAPPAMGGAASGDRRGFDAGRAGFTSVSPLIASVSPISSASR